MINLLPPQIKQDRKYGKRNRTLFTYCILMLLIGVSSAAVLLFNLQLLRNDTANLQEEITAKQAEISLLEQDQADIKKIATNLNLIEQLYGSEIVFSELIPKIGGLLPPGTVLNGLTLTGGKNDPLNLEIDMDTQELAAVFQQNLVSSDIFQAADITSIVSKTSESSEGSAGEKPFSATITVSFEGAKKKPAATPAAGGTAP